MSMACFCRLVYSFEITAQGRSGTQEVLVDANDGGVMSVQQEDGSLLVTKLAGSCTT